MKKGVREFILINIGNMLLAGGIYFFLVPNDLAVGGVTGLAMVINHYLPFISLGALMIMMNIILFVIGFIFIGPNFGAKTIYASFSLSGMIWILEKVYPMKVPFTNDLLVELLFGILIGAVGMAIVFNQNASTGGTDIIAKILNKYFHTDIGKSLLMADFFVTLLAAIAFGPKIGMYALLGVILNGLTIDAVIGGLNSYNKVEVVSEKEEEITKFIIKELDRGATIYIAQGAYTGKEKRVITTVVGKKEFIRLKNFIKDVDKQAFIMTYTVHETLGEGFKDLME